MDKRRQPRTCCTHCGAVGYDIAQSNSSCRRVLDRKDKKCKGGITSAINIGHWDECPNCHATGISVGKSCEPCRGPGWNFVRERP